MTSGEDANGWTSVQGHVPCRRCRYDLIGLSAGGVCPECAEAVASSVAAWDEKRPARRRAIVRWLLRVHMACAFALLALIAAYHVNGRAWFDYGWSAWNPPPYRSSSGVWTVVDYDPKYTRPFVWPGIGDIWSLVSALGLFVTCPPIGPGVALALPLQIAVWQEELKGLRVRRMLIAWGIGLLPYVYAVLWGGAMVEWLMD